MLALHRDLDRLMASVLEPASFETLHPMRGWMPAMDVLEAADAFVVRADLPGVDADDVHVELEGRTLTVAGERRFPPVDGAQGYARIERAAGSFRRVLTLPEGVEPDAIRATFDRGVLELRVPKPATHRRHRIAIATGEAPAQIEQ